LFAVKTASPRRAGSQPNAAGSLREHPVEPRAAGAVWFGRVIFKQFPVLIGVLRVKALRAVLGGHPQHAVGILRHAGDKVASQLLARIQQCFQFGAVQRQDARLRGEIGVILLIERNAQNAGLQRVGQGFLTT